MSWRNVVRRAKAATTEITASDMIEQSVVMTQFDFMMFSWKKAAHEVCLFPKPLKAKKVVEVVL